MPTSHQPITIFSGGSAANSLVDVFTSLAQQKSCPLAYIIPISDNGGSSSELIRVFGGPGIGDIRSRLVRLIPPLPKGSPGYKERKALATLLSYRLSSTDRRAARVQWDEVVDGTSELWRDISSAKKELIRSIFNLVNLEIIKRSRPPSSTFDFTSASVGNLFLTGARLFTGSFESAIYLMSSVCGISDEEIKIVPSVNSNFSHHIAAGLEDGSVIVGQNAISHPSPVSVAGGEGAVGGGKRSVLRPGVNVITDGSLAGNAGIGLVELDERRTSIEHYHGDEEAQLQGRQEETPNEELEEEDAHLPGTLLTLRTKNITFDKNFNAELPARISRVWYINPYGQEMLPPANPRATAAIGNAQAIIYSIGSLYTSLAPSLVLRGVGDALRRNTAAGGSGKRTKILILNGSLDREVGPLPPAPGSHGQTFSAIDFVDAIVRACEQSRGIIWEASGFSAEGALTPDIKTSSLTRQPSDRPRRPGLLGSKSETITTTLASAHSRISQHVFAPPLLASAAPSRTQSRDPSPPAGRDTNFSSSSASPSSSITPSGKRETKPDPIYNAYVTHIVHLPNSDITPYVDRDLLLKKCGIQCVKAYGRKHADGSMRYDPAALRGAIEAILGRKPEKQRQSDGGSRGSGGSGIEANGTTDDDAVNKTDDALTRKKTREEDIERRRAQGVSGPARRNTVDSYS